MNGKETTASGILDWVRHAAFYPVIAPCTSEASAASRRRWAKTFMTVALLLTGIVAWALALVQPWTKNRGDRGMIAIASSVDPEKVRQAAADIEKFLCESAAPSLKPLRWDPFQSGRPILAESGAKPAPAPQAEESNPSAPRKAENGSKAASAPQQTLQMIKGLKLEVVLITATGERWAVINGESYRVGDEVAGMHVTEIKENTVKLQQGGTTCLLRID